MIALVLELNLLASSSWSRTQSALLTLVAADDDLCRTGQTSVMFHEKIQQTLQQAIFILLTYQSQWY